MWLWHGTILIYQYPTQMIKDFSEYKPCGNPVIDRVANIIACARANQQPIKTISMKPLYYEWFKSGVQTLMGKPLEPEQQLQFDGVDIEKGSIYQVRQFSIEYYKTLN